MSQGVVWLLFEVGRVRWTRRVLEHDAISSEDLVQAFSRYVKGDWGELNHSGELSNDLSLTCGGPVVGRYVSSDAVTFLMVTATNETVVFLPGDDTETERLLHRNGESLVNVLSHVLDYGMV